MKYQVGDRVRVLSDLTPVINNHDTVIVSTMQYYEGNILTITSIDDLSHRFQCEENRCVWDFCAVEPCAYMEEVTTEELYELIK